MRTVLAVLLLAACSGKGDKPAPSTTGSGSATTPAGSATTPSEAPKAGSAEAKTDKKLPAEDPEAHKKYRAALNKGRKATDAKNYKDAIAAFDEALVIKKGDARATSERGYARLLAGDLDGAAKDFDVSAARTKDAKLLSSIWYNRGLAEEKRGNEDSALVAFYMANALRPTDAAKRKIEGKTVCPVTVARSFALMPDITNTWEATDWQDLAKQTIEELDGKRPATEAEAVEKLFDAKTAPSLPAMMMIHTFEDHVAYVVWKDGAKIRALPVGYAMNGRCPGNVWFEIVATSGSLVHIHVTEEQEGGHTYMCEGKKDGELVECSGADDEVSAGTACLGGLLYQRDLVFDTKKGTLPVSIEQPSQENKANQVRVTLDPAGLKLSSKACGDRLERL